MEIKTQQTQEKQEKEPMYITRANKIIPNFQKISDYPNLLYFNTFSGGHVFLNSRTFKICLSNGVEIQKNYNDIEDLKYYTSNSKPEDKLKVGKIFAVRVWDVKSSELLAKIDFINPITSTQFQLIEKELRTTHGECIIDISYYHKNKAE